MIESKIQSVIVVPDLHDSLKYITEIEKLNDQ